MLNNFFLNQIVHIPELTKFCNDLNQQAQDIAASEAPVGLKQVEKKNVTRPASPNINRPRLQLGTTIWLETD